MRTSPFGTTPQFSVWVNGTEALSARLVRVEDWSSIIGGEAYVAHSGTVVRHGVVETTTADASIAWVTAGGTGTRQLIDKAEGHELWIAPDQLQNIQDGRWS